MVQGLLAHSGAWWGLRGCGPLKFRKALEVDRRSCEAGVGTKKRRRPRCRVASASSGGSGATVPAGDTNIHCVSGCLSTWDRNPQEIDPHWTRLWPFELSRVQALVDAHVLDEDKDEHDADHCRDPSCVNAFPDFEIFGMIAFEALGAAPQFRV